MNSAFAARVSAIMGAVEGNKSPVTGIHKEIRDRLGVKEGERVVFVLRGEEVVLKVIRGTILDRRNSVRPRR
jgi:AbrB family looped-hinge helix DNA binding protein